VLDLARETGGAVKVAIIGTGKMGRGFATALASTHQVTVGSRDPDRARKVASATGATRGATYAEAAADAEVVILTVPWPAIDDTLGQLGELNQTVVIDVSWPARKSEREALAGSSTAEQIQKRLPHARVV
jgi:predicted dinucleotide-binding enzyme